MWKIFTVLIPFVWLARIFSLISTRSIVMNLMSSCISILRELTCRLKCITLRTLYPSISAPSLSLTNLLYPSSLSLTYCSYLSRASASYSSFWSYSYFSLYCGVIFCFSFPCLAYGCKGFDFFFSSWCLREGLTTVTVIFVSKLSDLDELSGCYIRLGVWDLLSLEPSFF
jgi:hypothetical protein